MMRFGSLTVKRFGADDIEFRSGGVNVDVLVWVSDDTAAQIAYWLEGWMKNPTGVQAQTFGDGDGSLTFTGFEYVVEIDLHDGVDDDRISLGLAEAKALYHGLMEML